MKVEKNESGPVRYNIRGIENDMGEGITMNFLVEQDGDVVITLFEPGKGSIEMNINTFQGGTRTPGLAKRLRQVAEFLYNSQQPGFEDTL
jgi:hypothetical protein